MYGFSTRAPKSNKANVFEKTFALLLSFALVASFTPTPAWAQSFGNTAAVSNEAVSSQEFKSTNEFGTEEGDASGSEAEDASGSDLGGADSGPNSNTGGAFESGTSGNSASPGDVHSGAISGSASLAGSASDDCQSPLVSSQQSTNGAFVSSGASSSSDKRALSASETASAQDPQAYVTEAKTALENLSFYKVSPCYGVDANINDVLKKKLSELGFPEIEVRLAKADPISVHEDFTAALSTADNETNGDITYASYDPNAAPPAFLTLYRSFKLEFELSYEGCEETWAQKGNTVLPWDEAECSRLFLPYADGIAVSYAEGDSESAVTCDFTLPHKALASNGEELKWSSVAWEVESGEGVTLSGGGYEDYRATVSCGVSDQQVVLTATMSIVSSGAPEVCVQRSFSITVKGDASQTNKEKQELQALVDAAFTAEALKYIEDGSAVDLGNVTDDVALPNPRKLGVDGKYYRVSYASGSDAISVNGYRGNVKRALPGSEASSGVVTVTVAKKENPDIVATKSIELNVAPLVADEIDAEIALMDEAKAGYAQAISNGQGLYAVTGDLRSFQKAYRDDDGGLAWSYDASDKVGDGIVPVELEGASELTGYRLFKSSNPLLVKHENLLVTRPVVNTDVTVTSCLASEKFARYAEMYADDLVWGSKFSQLAGQNVSATFTLPGTVAVEDAKVSASLSVIGVDEYGVAQMWAAPYSYTLDAGATVADLTETAFATAGITADYTVGSYGFYINTITSPFDGRSLGWNEATGEFWQLFVNGKAAETGASSIVLQPGDVVAWSYSADGEALPGENDIVIDPNAPHPDVESSWPGFMAGNSVVDVVDGQAALPTGKVDALWQTDFADLSKNEYVSEPIIVDGKVFVAAHSALYVKDVATGATLASGVLAAPIDSVSRMVYAKGMVIVPLSGGRLQALSATPTVDGILPTVWMTEKLPATESQWGTSEQQSLCTLTLDGDCLYYGTTDAGDPGVGYLVCIDVATGAVKWKNESKDAGFYWSGVGVTGDFVLIGDDAGFMRALNKADGSVTDMLRISEKSIRSTTVVAPDGKTAYVVSLDGVLHKVEVSEGGKLSETGNVKFAYSSTSTPTLSDGKIIVGGQSEQYDPVGKWMKYRYASLSIIDVKTLTVEKEITSTADGKTIGGKDENGGGTMGDVKSMPLVVNQGGQTYVYFTSNMKPGGVYCYRMGDDAATLIYEPAPDNQEFTMASLAMGPDGMLYYVNDSKTLFALPGVEGTSPQPNPGPDSSQKPGSSNGSDSDGAIGSDENAAVRNPLNGGVIQAMANAPAAAKTPLGGAIAPNKKPLTDEKTRATTEDGKTNASLSQDDSAAASSGEEVLAKAIGASGAHSTGGGVPGFAVAGVTLGCAGLAASLAWGITLHRRNGR